MLNNLWILLSGLLLVAMPSAQAGEFNLYSMNTGSYVYHMTGNHGQYNEHFNNNFFSVERKFSADSKYSALVGTMKKQLRRSLSDPRRAPRLAEKRHRLAAERRVCLYRGIFL